MIWIKENDEYDADHIGSLGPILNCEYSLIREDDW